MNFADASKLTPLTALEDDPEKARALWMARRCPICATPLTRKTRRDGTLESEPKFRERQYCGRVCARKNPLNGPMISPRGDKTPGWGEHERSFGERSRTDNRRTVR